MFLTCMAALALVLLMIFCLRLSVSPDWWWRRVSILLMLVLLFSCSGLIVSSAILLSPPSSRQKAEGASIDQVMEGVRRFQRDVLPGEREFFKRLAQGQAPRVLLITCSDSRIDVHLFTQTRPGDLFILRNAGNIVPPHTGAGGSEAATIEYAISVLKVEHIIVVGHSHCGAMHGLVHPEELSGLPSVAAWMEHARQVREKLEDALDFFDDQALLQVAVEENVLLQLKNLLTHPAVREALAGGRLALHGWVFEIESGQVMFFDERAGKWRKL